MENTLTTRMSGKVLGVAYLFHQSPSEKNKSQIHILLAGMKESELIALAYYMKTGWFVGINQNLETKFDLEIV